MFTSCKYLGEVREPALLKGVVIRYPVVSWRICPDSGIVHPRYRLMQSGQIAHFETRKNFRLLEDSPLSAHSFRACMGLTVRTNRYDVRNRRLPHGSGDCGNLHRRKMFALLPWGGGSPPHSSRVLGLSRDINAGVNTSCVGLQYR